MSNKTWKADAFQKEAIAVLQLLVVDSLLAINKPEVGGAGSYNLLGSPFEDIPGPLGVETFVLTWEWPSSCYAEERENQ